MNALPRQDLTLSRAGALQSLIRFDDPYDGIVQRLMETIDHDLDGVDPPPTLRRQDLSSLFARVRRHEITPRELQQWARVVEGLPDIAVESPRLYSILSELATEAVTPGRFAEIQLALVA
jgi:hypothetical protein